MNELRKEFEGLPYIKSKIEHYGVKYVERIGYIASYNYSGHADFVNGAWYAYQEQHKKIVAYQKIIEMEKCLNKANILSSDLVMHGEYYIDEYDLLVVNGALHHGENVIHVGTVDNPNQTLTINVDENGNIDVINDNGEQE